MVCIRLVSFFLPLVVVINDFVFAAITCAERHSCRHFLLFLFFSISFFFWFRLGTRGVLSETVSFLYLCFLNQDYSVMGFDNRGFVPSTDPVEYDSKF